MGTAAASAGTAGPFRGTTGRTEHSGYIAGIYYNPNQQRQIHAVAKKEAQVVRPLLRPARSPWKGSADGAAVPLLQQLPAARNHH